MRLTVLLYLFIAALSWAQQPFSVRVLATVGAPSEVVYGNGMKSIDGGRTWTPLYLTEPGLPQPTFTAIEVDVDNPNTLYVITDAARGSFWKSTDAGATWKTSNTNLPADASPVTLRQTRSAPHGLYVRAGNRIYKSTDRGETWTLKGTIPGTEPLWETSVASPIRMYAVDREAAALDSLRVFASDDEGATWNATGTIPYTLFTTRSPTAIGVHFGRPNTVYIGVGGCCDVGGQGTFISENGGATFGQLGNGIGIPTGRFFSGPGPAMYVNSQSAGGFYATRNSGGTWTSYFIVGSLGVVGVSAMDPNDTTIVWGSGSSAGLVRSTDAANNWTAVPSTITPTIAKPAAMVQIEVEQGATLSQPLPVRAMENAALALPVTLVKSDEPWLALSGTTGNTPFTPSLIVRATDLTPGVYTASIRIDAATSFNKSVTLPVQVTVRARGTLSSPYRVSTVMGTGTSGSTFEGPAASVSAAGIVSLAADPQNRLLIAGTGRIRRLNGATVEAVAGDGTATSTGDGGFAVHATVNPEALAIHPQGDIFLAERFDRKVRRIRDGAIGPYLGTTQGGASFSPVGLTMDGQSRLIVLQTTAVHLYDGTTYAAITPQFSTGINRGTAIAVGPDGAYYIADAGAHRILRLATPGSAALPFAGTGAAGFSGDGGPALSAQFDTPMGLGFNRNGTLFVSDSGNHRIRAISPDGIVTTVAGNGVAAFVGDGQPGNFASLNSPGALAVDSAGAIYVADRNNSRIRKLEPGAAPRPDALLHGASGNARLSPGSLFSIYGNQLAGSTRVGGETPWPRSMDGVVVTINGVAAPLYYVSPTQINGQIPYETAVGTATALVTYNGSNPAQMTFPVIAANPGVLVYNGDRAVAVNPDGSVNAVNAGAKPGDVELLYFSGIGVPNTPVATGAGSPGAEPLGRSQYPSSIQINGQPVEVFYLGLAPGYPALCQANFRIPNLPPGDYPLTVTVNGEQSNTVMLTITAP